MREPIEKVLSPLMALTIDTRVPESGSHPDFDDSSSDDTIFTPNSSTPASPHEMIDTSSIPLLSWAAPMGHDLEAAATSITTPTPTPALASTNPETILKLEDYSSTSEAEQGTETTTTPGYPNCPYTSVAVAAGNILLFDHRRNAPSSIPAQLATDQPGTVGDSLLNNNHECGDSRVPSVVVSNANEVDDDLREEIEILQREEEMRQIEDAIEASRAALLDIEAVSFEQARIMLYYAEDLTTPRPNVESKEDEEFFSELLPTDIEAEDDDIEDEIDDLDLEDDDYDDDNDDDEDDDGEEEDMA